MKGLLATIFVVLCSTRSLNAANDTCQPIAATCVSELYPFGFSENDSNLNRSIDDSSPPIIFSENFYFYNEIIRVVYVGDNGVISFNNSYNDWIPRSLPINEPQFIAPYWADFDLTATGNVFYRQTRDPDLLVRATNEIRAAFPMSQNVIVYNLLIVTWDAVGYYYGNSDKTNTLQCILATTLTESFVMFLYADGMIQWTTGDDSGGFNGLGGTEALAGINAGDGINSVTIPGSLTPDIINIAQTSNVGIPGIWMFKVGEDQPSASPRIFLQPSGFDQNTIGQRQDVICSISVPPDVDPDTIELGWLNEEDIVTDDSRVTIIDSFADPSNDSSNFTVNMITTVIQFDPLFEEDEGNYSCYAIVNETERSTSIQLQNFRIPIPHAQIAITENETSVDYASGQSGSGDNILRNITVGDPLTLDCTVTAVRGISSSVSIIWTTGSLELRRADDITADIENDSAIYSDSFKISSLSAIDSGREYQCTVMINATQPVYSGDQFMLTFFAPVCFNTMYCQEESVSDNSISFEQCCFDLSGVSFASSGQCLLCPASNCSIIGVEDIVFVIDTHYSIGQYQFQIIREFVDNITINLKLNSPDSSAGIILFDNSASILFNLEEHTSLSTLSPAINPGLPYNYGYGRNTAAALNLLLSSAQDGSLGIRNETSNIAIVITGGRSNNNYSTESAAAALHATNIFDVYAIGYGNADINELNTIASDPHFVHFVNIFNILDLKESQLNVTDQLCSLPIPRISHQPSRGVVGDMQDIICLVTITSAIDPNLVELTWTHDNNNVTTDNRVTIIPTNITENPSSFTYTTTIQFAYLMEGDEGNYTCKVSADNMIKSHSIVLQNLRIPSPVVEVFSADSVEYGQAATLECNVTAARGITSRVDIIWSNGLTVKTVENVTANIVNNSAVYSDQLVTPPLSVNDSGRVYYCKVSIKATFEITSLNRFTLDFVVPSCYITPRCIGEPVNKSITFYDCCKSYGVAFDLDGRCQSCPSTNCSSHVVRDVVFVIDTKRYRYFYSRVQLIKEIVENIATALKIASPETLFGLITYSRYSAYYQFDILTHTNLSTLLPAIDSELSGSYSSSYFTNIPRALSLLLSGGREGGYLNLRNKTSNVAIVITDGSASSSFSLRSTASSLHRANIFDVYAVGVGNHRSSDLRLIASDPSFIFSTNSLSTATAQQLGQNVIGQLCSTPPPRVFLRNNKVLQPRVQNAYELVCLIVLSSTVQSSSVNLTWNLTSNDTRVRVIPTTITTDDSIGISYSTVIQFDHLMGGIYMCTVMINGNSAESTFNFIDYNVSIVSNPPGFIVGDNNTYEYFYGTDVRLTCLVYPAPPVYRTLSWGCSTRCFANGRTTSTVSVSGLDEGDSGIINCSMTINGIQYYSEPFGLQVTTDESCRPDKVTCITEFYPFGLSENDTALPSGDDVTSSNITMAEKFYFYGRSVSFAYVGSNGIISLNTRYNPSSSRTLPLYIYTFIAPFWHDVDTRGTGEIYYRQSTNSTLLARATKEIRTAFSTSHNVNITNLFIATWNAVGYYSRRTDKTNTFQCVLATSATESFVLFLYADGKIQRSNSALAGLNAGDGINYETVPGSRTSSIATISRTTNVGIPGIWMFKVDEAICLNGCHNGGVCRFPGLCTCSDGWSGNNCTTPLCPGGCLNGGSCTSPGVCTCHPSWTGSNCTQDINECAGDHGCHHLCNNTDGSFHCYCNPGYILHSNGIICRDINECLINNGGCEFSCTNLEGINNTTGLGYQCGCDSGYQLTPNNHNCTDTNECVGDHGCHHLCNNTDGSFHCYCNPGYMLHSNGTTCTDIDECFVNNGGCESICTNLEGINHTTGLGYQCGCDYGYKLAADNHDCNDIDECVEGTDGCDHNCTNTDGSYYCTCMDGYKLESDNHMCTDVNECTLNIDDCDQFCVNDIGSYHCECHTGYFRDNNSSSCIDINECAGDHGCHHLCNNTDGSFHCYCNPGYMLHSNGTTCTDIDECLVNNGGCESICTNLEGINNATGLGYQCGCDNGYQLAPDNHDCNDINECTGDHGCHHLCNNTDGSFHCYCNPGYMLHSNGTTCTDIDECLIDNGGCEFSCTNLEGINNTTGLGYQCGCDYGYHLALDNHDCNDIDECLIDIGGCKFSCTNLEGINNATGLGYQCGCDYGYKLAADNHDCYADTLVKSECMLTPINPTTLTSAGGTLPNGTESVIIHCNCTNDNGKKINRVRWYDPDGNRLRSRRFNKDVPYFARVTDHDNSNIILVIPIFTNSFDGVYTCGTKVNERQGGPLNAAVNLTIDANIPVITMQPMDATIQLIANFTNHTLTCKADEASSYYWEKGNDIIPSDSNILTLINLRPKDAGSYRCVATNAIGTSKSDYALITISVHAPRVVSHPTNTSAASPFGAHFSCSIQAYGYLTITWYRSYRNPVQSKASSTIKQSMNVATSVLYIPNVTSEDVDTYFCEAWANRMAAHSLNAKLLLTVPPPQPPVVMTDTAINLTVNDYNLTMKCLPYQSIFDYVWIKGNGMLPLRAKGVNSSQLTILDLKPEDSGSYQCVMSNSTGKIHSSFVMVDIRVSLPKISEQPNNKTIDIFKSVSLNCTARGFGLSEIIWKRIRYAIPVIAETTSIISVNEITSVLKITNTVGYYSGQYYCIAKNEAGETESQIAYLNVTVPMPEIIICPKNVTVFPNDNFTMNCLALSFGSLKYHWSKHEEMLPQTAKTSFKYISEKATNVYNLEMYNAQPSDEGSYCCKATNEAGSRVCCAWLEVNTLPNITTQPIPQVFKIGDVNVTAMSCSAVGMGPIHVKWEKYDSLNNSWMSPSHRASRIMSFDLKFSVITEDDEGIYRCVITNNDGRAVSDNATIHVYGPPIITFITNHIVKQEGEKVNLICSAVNDFDAIHPLQINWYKGNKLVTQIERHVVLYKAPDNVSRQQNLTIVFDSVNHTDDGEYTCRAFNHNNSFSESKTNLTIQCPPIISITNKSPYITSVGSFAVLHCKATCKPIPIVEWYINDNIIDDPFPLFPHPSRGSRLLLVPTHKSHTTIYTCKGINYIGNMKHTSSSNITAIVKEN